MTPDERAAVALYAILSRDVCDFLNDLPTATTATLETLLQMLQHPNDRHDRYTRELNADGARFVQAQLDRRSSV